MRNDVHGAVGTVDQPAAADFEICQAGAAQLAQHDGPRRAQLKTARAGIEYGVASHRDAAAARLKQQVAAGAAQVGRVAHDDAIGGTQSNGAAVSDDALRQRDAAAAGCDGYSIAKGGADGAHNAQRAAGMQRHRAMADTFNAADRGDAVGLINLDIAQCQDIQ